MTESDQPRDAPTETERALRATSDALLANIEELATLEQEKRIVKAGDPRLVELSKSIERIAARVLGGTIEERVLTEVSRSRRSSPARRTKSSRNGGMLNGALPPSRRAHRRPQSWQPASSAFDSNTGGRTSVPRGEAEEDRFRGYPGECYLSRMRSAFRSILAFSLPVRLPFFTC